MRARRVLATLSLLVVVGATATACGSDDESTDAAADATTTTVASESDHDHSMDGMDHSDGAMEHGDHGDHGAAGAAVEAGQVIPSTADGTSPCEVAQPAPASAGQAGTGEGGESGHAAGEHGHRGLVKQYDLTNDERLELIDQMAAARTVIDRYPTVADAEAAGYKMSTVFVPCIGAHYTNISLVGQFDPAKPSELLYDGTEPDSKIIGLSFLVVHADGPPEGFAGKNDLWHQHNANGGLCLKKGSVTVIGGEDVSEEECAQRGGEKAGNLMENVWMVHAWVAPGYECSWGVFAGECPELGGKLGGTAWD